MDIVSSVQEFNECSNQKCYFGEIPDYKFIDDRKGFLDEESREFDIAFHEKDKVEMLDAVLDQIYIIVGTAERLFGASVIKEGLQRVHDNNMTKFPDLQVGLDSIEFYKQKGITCELRPLPNGRYAIIDTLNNKVKKPYNFIPVSLIDLV